MLPKISGLLLALIACGRGEDPPTASAPAAPDSVVEQTRSLEVEIAGCRSTRREPLTCSVGAGTTTLDLWIGGRVPPVIRVDGAPARARVWPSPSAAGWTAELAVGPDARELEVQTDGARAWVIVLEPAPPTPIVDELNLLRERSAPEQVGAVLGEIATRLEHERARMSPYERVLAGRMLMLVARERGDTDGAVAAGQRSLDDALSQGLLGEAIDVAQILVFLREQRGEQLEAQLLLDIQGLYLPLVADGGQALRWHYYRGVRANATGDLSLALDELEIARSSASRLGLHVDEAAAASLLTPLLGFVGRTAERDAGIERMLAVNAARHASDACTSAAELNAVGWTMLLSRTSDTSTETCARLFERARGYFAPGGGCEAGDNPERTLQLQEIRINAAIEALVRNDWRAAEAHAAEIASHPANPGQRAWLDYTLGVLALQRGDPLRALEHTAKVRAAGDPLLAWQTLVVRGQALEAAKQPDAALAAYGDAERALDAAVLRLGVDQGREGLLAGRHSSASHMIDIHLARGQIDAAAAVARRSRTRAVRPIGRAGLLNRLSPADRRRWQDALAHANAVSRTIADGLTDMWRLPQQERDELLRSHVELRRRLRAHLADAYRVLATGTDDEAPLPELERGAVSLLYHPSGDGWVGFAMSGAETTVSRFSSDVAVRAPDELLAPFSAAIEAAQTVRVLSMGALVDVPVHLLAWHGQPLVAGRAVAYALDIPSPHVAPAVETDARALVVADPRTRGGELGRLAAAADEGAEAERALRERGWSVTPLYREGASHSAVVEGLARSEWLHYAGHGAAAGGWDSALPLAGDATLDVRQILASPRVPSVVVLSGCRTGALDATAAAGGQHLAGAFLLAGARFVIASTDDLDDRDALALTRALYSELGSRAIPDGAALLRRSLLRLAANGEGELARWRGIRVWIP